MEMNDYQDRSSSTAVYPDVGNNIIYPALGLVGEAGEFVNKLKKTIRDNGGMLDETTRYALVGELGDVLWYLSMLAAELGFTLGEVANANLDKLESRKERDALHGEGDER